MGKTEKNDEGKDREKESSVYEATMECRYYAPGQLVCALGSQGAAHFIECGVLEATFVKSNNVKNKNNSDVSWRAHPGDVVQPFALLANTRSSIELEAGSSGAVVATLVSVNFTSWLDIATKSMSFPSTPPAMKTLPLLLLLLLKAKTMAKKVLKKNRRRRQ